MKTSQPAVFLNIVTSACLREHSSQNTCKKKNSPQSVMFEIYFMDGFSHDSAEL